MDATILWLGTRKGVSQSTGKAYCRIGFALEDNRDGIKTYTPVSSYANDPNLERKCFTLEPLKFYRADVRYINRQSVLIDVFEVIDVK